jgi:gluconokinase
MPEIVIGIDAGTSSTKAIAVEPSGREVAAARVQHRLEEGPDGRLEQDPEQIARAVVESLVSVVGLLREGAGDDQRPGSRRDRRSDVAGICLGTQMQTLLAIDRHGRPITPLLTYADLRAAPQAERLAASERSASLYERTGVPLHPFSPLAKLCWFREEQPDLWRAAERWLSIKDHVVLGLTGRLAVDQSIASGTGLLDIRGLGWDPEALELAGIESDRLSPLVPATEVVGSLLPEVADRVDLPSGTPVVIGGADGPLSSLGSGTEGPNGRRIGALNMGTSAAVRVILDRPLTDPKRRTFTYVLGEGRWVLGAATSNGTLVLRWLADRLVAGSSADRTEVDAETAARLENELLEEAAALPAGAEGLFALPYLAGERAPLWPAWATGAIVGLRMAHRRGHVVRACLEGVAFGLRSMLAALDELGVGPTELRASGGFLHSPAWLGFMADALDRPLAIPDSEEPTALGTALLGMVGLGILPSLDEAALIPRTRGLAEPGPGAARYAELWRQHEEIRDRLMPLLAEVSRGGAGA